MHWCSSNQTGGNGMLLVLDRQNHKKVTHTKHRHANNAIALCLRACVTGPAAAMRNTLDQLPHAFKKPLEMGSLQKAH